MMKRAFNSAAASTSSLKMEPDKSFWSTFVPSVRSRRIPIKLLRLGKSVAQTIRDRSRQSAELIQMQQEQTTFKRLAIAAAISTASTAVAEKTVQQTIGRSSFFGSKVCPDL